MPVRKKQKMSEFDQAILAIIIGVVIIFVKGYTIAVPVFGKEADFFGLNWKVHISNKVLFWRIVSYLLIAFGSIRAVTIMAMIKKKRD